MNPIDNIFGGSEQPRVILLSESGATLDTIDLDFSHIANNMPLHCKRNENPEKIIETKILANGNIREKFGGFRFKAEYEWPVLDEASRDVIASILNHPHHIYWYPHKDLLDVRFECVVTGGDVYNLVKVGGIDRAFHRGNISLIGVNVIPYIPGALDWVHVTSDDAWGSFSDAEKAVVFSVSSDDAWSSFSAVEKRRCRIARGNNTLDSLGN